MFENIPSYQMVQTVSPLESLPRITAVHHETARDPSYCSRGEIRGGEMHCIFHYTIRGGGEVLYKGKTFPTKAGDGFFNIINEENSGYGYPVGKTEPWEFIVICFDGGAARSMTAELLKERVVYSAREGQGELNRLCEDVLRGPLNAGFSAECVCRLISILRRESEPALCERFREIAERERFANPTIEAMAAELGVSREHLQRVYTAGTGISPAKYVARLRLGELCRLLRQPIPEAEIAEQMTFGSVAGMIAFFKRHTGMTPGKYRQSGSYPV